MKRKTRKRKIFVTLGIIAVIIAGVFLALIYSMDWIVASAIETYGSKATGTNVEVSSVRIRLLAGKVSIQGLAVGNPEGFSGRDAIRLENITLTVSPRRLIGDTIVIDEIFIREPRVLYETSRPGESNIRQIQTNLEKSRKAEAREKTSDTTGKKIIIRSLVIEEGTVLVQIGTLTEKPFSAALPRIALKNLGGNGKASQTDVTRQIIGSLVKEATAAVPSATIGKSLDETFRSIFNR